MPTINDHRWIRLAFAPFQLRQRVHDVAAGGEHGRRGRARPVFTRARHYFWQAEWDFWTSDHGLGQADGDLAEAARTHLPPLHQAGLVELAGEETGVLPGVRLLPAPGAYSRAFGGGPHLRRRGCPVPG